MGNNYFIIPGLGNSGEKHWQTFFEKSAPNFKRINQAEWDSPDRDDWINLIDKTVAAYDPATVVLIGHSLGCTAIAYWALTYGRKIKGALLVAPSDTEALSYNFPTTGFTPVPSVKIDFPTIVVASSNDPWVSLDRAKHFASNWNSRFVNIGKSGHINAASGHYEWTQGLEILSGL